MRPKLSKGYSQYGAQMGRYSSQPDEEPHKFYLRRIGPDSQGYDEEGAYWGSGRSVYWATDDYVDFFTRARNREEAKEEIKRHFPQAKFYT